MIGGSSFVGATLETQAVDFQIWVSCSDQGDIVVDSVVTNNLIMHHRSMLSIFLKTFLCF